MFAPVYFDYNATTPMLPEVRQAMAPWLAEHFGNASSRHEYGRAARRAVDTARDQVAAAVGAHASEVIFTSCGTEANNLLIKGAAGCLPASAIAIGATEHPSVVRPAEQLVRRGWSLLRIAVDGAGRIDRTAYAKALDARPQLISLMLANNETGVLTDVGELAREARGAIFHADAVQALGKIAIDFRTLNSAGVRALTLSGHKVGAGKGAAALIIDKRVDLEPLLAGGGQERGLRSGTENVAAIVAFGVACELAASRLAESAPRLAALRSRIETGLVALGATLFGESAERLPNTVYFSLPRIDGETLIGHLDRAGFALASGSACSSAHVGPSAVLEAMGVAPEVSRGAVRLSLGPGSTADEVDSFVSVLHTVVDKLQRLAALAV